MLQWVRRVVSAAMVFGALLLLYSLFAGEYGW